MAEMVNGKRRLTKEQRLEQLLDCAIRIAAEKGLGQIAHADVAKEAGVGTPNVFRYFPSRRDLLRSIVAEISRFYHKQADPFYTDLEDPLKSMREHLVAFEKSIDTHPHYAATWLQWAASVQNDCGIWDMFQEHNESLTIIMSRATRKAHPKGKGQEIAVSHSRARIMFGTAFVLTTLKLSGADQQIVDQYLSAAVKGL